MTVQLLFLVDAYSSRRAVAFKLGRSPEYCALRFC